MPRASGGCRIVEVSPGGERVALSIIQRQLGQANLGQCRAAALIESPDYERERQARSRSTLAKRKPGRPDSHDRASSNQDSLKRGVQDARVSMAKR
jgi:hypothetical protein